MASLLTKIAIIAAVAVCAYGAAFRRIGVDMPRLAKSLTKKRDDLPTSVVFKPRELPCTYKIVESYTVTGPGYEAFEDDYIYVRGLMYKVKYDMIEAVQEVMVRGDQRLKDPNSDKVFVGYYAADTTFPNSSENLMLEEAEGLEAINEDLALFLEEQEFINVTNATFHGKSCKMYYTYDPDQQLDVYLFADHDHLILGYNLTSKSDKSQETVVMTYKWDAPLSSFVLNKTLFGDCNDTRAFKAPKVDFCAFVSSSDLSSFSSGLWENWNSKYFVTASAVFVLVCAVAVVSSLML